MDTENNHEFKCIKRLKKEELKTILDDYQKYTSQYTWAKIPILIMVVVFTIYNFFYAGKRYSISDYNTIKSTMIAIISIVVISLIVAVVILFKSQGQLRSKIKVLAKNNNIPYKELKKELNIAVKSYFGGPGI